MAYSQAALEAILYVSGDAGVKLSELAQLLTLDEAALRQQLQRYAEKLTEDPQRGLQLMENGDYFQLVTKPDFADLLKLRYSGLHASSLSSAALEVLAIVVYQQPVTRVEIDEIRGVQSSGALQTLVMRQLVQEKSRKEVAGRPILYATTDYFLNYFGLQSLAELPDLASFQAKVSAQTTNNDLFYQNFKQTLNPEKQGESNHGKTASSEDHR